MNSVATLKAVLNTLEGIQVAGHKNLDRLLGSMQAIEAVIQALSTSSAATEEVEQEEADGR